MKISTKGKYGLRSMLDLAVNSSGDQVPLSSIAERQNISVNYLEQVFSALRKAGLVKSVKGAQGGYVLADHPSKITVGTILRCLEGDLMVVSEDLSDDIPSGYSIQRCIKENVWDKINESVEKVVDSLTLEDLVTEYKRKNEKYVPMYYI